MPLRMDTVVERQLPSLCWLLRTLPQLAMVARCQSHTQSSERLRLTKAVVLADLQLPMVQHRRLWSGTTLPTVASHHRYGLFEALLIVHDVSLGRHSSLRRLHASADLKEHTYPFVTWFHIVFHITSLILLLCRRALDTAEAPASALGVISVHGTGTPLGDPIEVGGLAAALADEGGAPALLSSKATFGHTEGTAGITGGFLTVVCLRLLLCNGLSSPEWYRSTPSAT